MERVPHERGALNLEIRQKPAAVTFAKEMASKATIAAEQTLQAAGSRARLEG
ncbi:MAG TPA: hypothetical protein VLZ03_11675 [Thermodesulfobacteriota bacterium]|nr:hypothetical protein [Thermodesulfobacteriota bacterium]